MHLVLQSNHTRRNAITDTEETSTVFKVKSVQKNIIEMARSQMIE